VRIDRQKREENPAILHNWRVVGRKKMSREPVVVI